MIMYIDLWNAYFHGPFATEYRCFLKILAHNMHASCVTAILLSSDGQWNQDSAIIGQLAPMFPMAWFTENANHCIAQTMTDNIIN